MVVVDVNCSIELFVVELPVELGVAVFVSVVGACDELVLLRLLVVEVAVVSCDDWVGAGVLVDVAVGSLLGREQSRRSIKLCWCRVSAPSCSPLQVVEEDLDLSKFRESTPVVLSYDVISATFQPDISGDQVASESSAILNAITSPTIGGPVKGGTEL